MVDGKAAKVCIQYLNFPSQKGEMEKWGEIPVKEREKVEPVLDFFETVGFYLEGGQISDEVVHHHFHHWMRGWYSNLKSYIDYYQKIENEEAAYINVRKLYDRVSLIEGEFPRPTVFLTTREQKLDFLEEESGRSESEE